LDTVKSLLSKTPLHPVDARVLLQHVCQKYLGWTKEQIISNNQEQLPSSVVTEWTRLETLRLAGHPVAYLTHRRAFHAIELYVNDHVLIPRPETEMLVDAAIQDIDRRLQNSAQQLCVLDLGTGSGAIILALAHHYAQKQVPPIQWMATDISNDALGVAQQNAKTLGLSEIEWLQSHWFEQVSGKRFDVILSNPPYISLDDNHLMEGDLRFEPTLALTDGKDGLDAYRTIALSVREFLNPGGFLALEHGYNQSVDVQKILLEHGLSQIKTLQDFSNLDRITQAYNG
jgi:release factor glutamine methyltransferase